MRQRQLTLLAAGPELPEGFKYQPDIISPEEEGELLEWIRELPFKEFEFHGFVGKRRVVSYGWRYNFSERTVQKADDIPAWLLPLREAAAEFAAVEPASLPQVLVTEYAPRAAIG